MKKATSLFALAALMLCLCSCMGKKPDDEASPINILNAALTAVGMKDRGIVYLSETDNDFEMLDDDILSGKYGELLDSPSVSMFESYAVFYSFDNYGMEIGVFFANTEEDAAAMEKYIRNRQQKLLDNAVNYPDLNTAHVSSLTVKADGRWVYYIMSDSAEIAVKEIEKNLYK